LVGPIVLIETCESKDFKALTSLEFDFGDRTCDFDATILRWVSDSKGMIVVRHTESHSSSVEGCDWTSNTTKSEESHNACVPS